MDRATCRGRVGVRISKCNLEFLCLYASFSPTLAGLLLQGLSSQISYKTAPHKFGIPMEPVTAWSLLIGAVMLVAALGEGPLKRIPVSLPFLYLLTGVAIGPWGLKLLDVDVFDDTKLVETITEIAVVISLLSAGLKLDPSWRHLLQTPIPLATGTMLLTIAAVTAIGVFFLGLPLGAAILLGAIIAPTDPVLAGAVQVKHHNDTDKLRYALTGEAGFNDGAAFPFIMLGLGLLGLHEIGDFGWIWFAKDLLWATFAGLGFGWLVGWGISRVASWLKESSDQPAFSEELLTLGMIGLSYGGGLLIHSYGFLAVFASGVAMRFYADSEQDESKHSDDLMKTVTSINEQIGQLLEVACVVLIGAMLANHWSIGTHWWLALVLFFVLRPVAVAIGLAFNTLDLPKKGLIGFFGIRGIGSVYYLSYAIDHDFVSQDAALVADVTFTIIACSLLIHTNVSSVVMALYRRQES